MKKIDKNKIKTWFVTGASSGIGYELSNQLISKGYNVVAVSRRKPDLCGEGVLCLSVDVRDINAVKNACDEGIKKFRKIDVLFNNAGVSSYGTIEEESIDTMKIVMDINWGGAFNTMRVLIPHFRENHNGTIINNTSENGIIARAFGAAYVSSKFALEGLTQSAWLELKNFARVMCVELSYFENTYIGFGNDSKTSINEYKDVPYLPIPTKNLKYPNDVKKAVSLIIEEIEKEKIQKHLFLGQDILEKVEYQISSLKENLEKSSERALSCFSLDHIKKRIGMNKNISHKKVACLNYHWENKNFGAVLTAYALSFFLRKKGYEVKNIKYIPDFPWIKEEKYNKFFNDFRKKYIPETNYYDNKMNLSPLNDYFSSFIVGSDQVWRPEFIQKDKDAYFFDFVSSEKKIISYAASFGIESLRVSEYEKKDLKKRLELFDYVGVRERSAVNICNELNIKSSQVIDPVFLLDLRDWDDLIDKENFDKKQYDICLYAIDDDIKHASKRFIKKLQEKYNYISFCDITENLSIENWLYLIKNCKFFISDSYHGSCFAEIFNKEFVCVNKNVITSTRMQSMFDDLGIEHRLFSSFDDIDIDQIISSPINYSFVNKRIKDLVGSGASFLLNALENKKSRECVKGDLKEKYLKFKYYYAKKNIKKLYFKKQKYSLLSKILSGKRRLHYRQKKIDCYFRYNNFKNIINLYETKYKK